jgi:hypothetical protein
MTHEGRLWKVVAFILLASSILAMFGWAALSTRYLDSLPRFPNVAEGRIYPFNYHGLVFYQTHAEKLRLDALLYAAIFLVAAGLSIAAFKLKMIKLRDFTFGSRRA